MGRTKCILICDEREMIEKVKSFGLQNGLNVQAYTHSEWQKGMKDMNFMQQLSGGGEIPALAIGLKPIDEGAKILPFPNYSPSHKTESMGKVQTINEMEARAIENAINEFNGNLTEAARALGIGRATLYRKVKQYQLDPSSARRKRVA